MRNLKKILALALALVMSMSLMATANAFTDDDSITDTYETAVTVLSGLKVFQGYDDGTFQPKGAITRAEVAAIIYRIVTGDVADTQVGIYADYNKFDDVASTSWYAGYVNFCANAEYIKGYDARTFGPNDPVTGYQALAMILRALGYDKNGEFTGTNWTIQTAAVGEQRGITKNITAGTLNVPATREVVAEILFRAILVPKATYTPAFGYQTSVNGVENTSIGWDTFELEDITGVVTANEYADLYSDAPMKAGRTELDVDGESYVIDYSTTLEDIGEAHAAYITGSTVLTIEKTGNTVFETGDEVDISSASKFENVTGMSRTGAEHFYNFDGNNTYKASDYRIKYVLTTDSPSDAAVYEAEYGITMTLANGEYTYEKTIRPEAAISDLDMQIMKDIFYDADLKDGNTEAIVMGEVYVGTQSTEDISDDRNVSWKSFVEEYIVTGENSTEVVGNENGNWLKVIDNDGDGEAEYVLKTIYTAAGVEDINRDGDIELTPLYITLDSTDDLNQLTKDIPVVTADELAEGDVVYYAVIDGNAQTYLADMVTAEIDRVNRNTLTATTTDGDEYIQSDVHNHVDWAGYDDGVRNLEGDVSYDLYLDKYGYLMVFTETAYSGNFALLTDGWFMSQRSGDEYAAMVWNGEDLVDTDITSGGSLFIYDDRNDNDWDNLKAFEDINDDGSAMLTIVAALSDNGDLVPVEDSTNTRDIRIIATDDNVIPGRDYETGDAYITGTNDRTAYDTIDSTNAEVRALSSTVYYYVYEESGDTIVDEYVGYANLPSLYDDDLALIEDVYVVGTRENRESNLGNATYYTANVVVVEFTRSYRANAEQVFIYDTPVVGNSVKLEDVDMIRADGTMDTVTIDLTKSVGATYDPAGEKRINPGLYYMWATNDEGVYVVERMTAEDIADSRYAVGQVSTSLATMDNDWVEVRQWNVTGETSEYDTYGYVADSSKTYTLDYSVEQYNWNDIWYLEAHMAEADAEDVLDEQVDISRDRDAAQANQDSRGYWWNNNDVLIAYNGDGDIIYAVSFNNYDTYTAAEMAYLALRQNVDYAQDVWGSLMAAVPGTTTVSFYGEKAVAGADADFEATVTYAEAKAAGDNGIAVSYGTIVSGDKTTAVTVDGDDYTGLIQGADGEYYTFKLTQSAALKNVSLVSLDSSVATVSGNEITVVDNMLSISEFMAIFKAGDDGEAKIDWTFENAQGVVDKADYGQSMMDVTKITAVVTAEDGRTTATYMDPTSATDAETDAITAAKNAAKNELNSFAAPLSEEIAADQLSSVGVYAKTWLEQYKNSGNTGYTVKTVLDAQLANIDSAVDANAAEVAMLNGKIAVRAEVVGAATNNLIRLVGGQASGTGTSFVGKYWNSSIDAAFDAALNAFNATLTLDDWADGSALTDVIDAYNTAFAAIQPEVQRIASDDAKAAVKTQIGNTVSYNNHGNWNAFVSLIETRIERATGVSNAVVTNVPPASYAQNDVITVTYTFDYAGVTYSDSTVVTVIA